MRKLAVQATLLLSGLMQASIAFAVTRPSPSPTVFDPTTSSSLPALPTGPKDFGSLIKVITTIAQWMFGLLVALSIVFILYAAFLYVIAQGNDERIGTAKKILIYAVVGLVVGVLAGGIGVAVQSFLGTTGI
jgi:hypothetical protein